MVFSAFVGMAVFFLLLTAMPSSWTRKIFMFGQRWQFESKPRPSALGLGVGAIAGGICVGLVVTVMVVVANDDASAADTSTYYAALAVISVVCLALFPAVFRHNRKRDDGMLFESDADREINEKGDRARPAGLSIAALAIAVGWAALLLQGG